FSVNGRAVLYAISPEWPVYVNGDAVERRVLAHDDDIQLAHYRLRFVDEPSQALPVQVAGVPKPAAPAGSLAPAPDAPAGGESPSGGGAPEPVPLQVDESNLPPLPPKSSAGGFHLDILTGINRGRRVPLKRGSRVVLGFNGERLLELRDQDGKLAAREAATGVNALLNGQPVGDRFRVLGPGDVLSVQRIDMRIGQDPSKEGRKQK
ncbi:MAG: hypothetical protein WB783_01130, partial [Arenicellales bacterium]